MTMRNSTASLLFTLCLSMAVLPACSSLGKKNDAPKYLGPEKTEQQYYESSVRLLKRAQFELATKDLKALDTYFPTGQYTEQAQLDLMYAQYRQGDYLGAVDTAERFVRIYTKNKQLDYAYYVLVTANMSEGWNQIQYTFKQRTAERDLMRMQAAFKAAEALTSRFPDSVYYNDTVQRMRYIRNLFAEKEMAAVEYSLKRGAWLAAIARANDVLTAYPNSASVPYALDALVYAYTELGHPAKAQNYQALLTQNFPNHRSTYRGMLNQNVGDRIVNTLNHWFDKTPKTTSTH